MVDVQLIYLTLTLHLAYAKFCLKCLSDTDSFNPINMCWLHNCYTFVIEERYLGTLPQTVCLLGEEIILEPRDLQVDSFILWSIHSSVHPCTHLFTKYLYFVLHCWLGPVSSCWIKHRVSMSSPLLPDHPRTSFTHLHTHSPMGKSSMFHQDFVIQLTHIWTTARRFLTRGPCFACKQTDTRTRQCQHEVKKMSFSPTQTF